MFGNFKPPVGSILNRSHPLSYGLVGCWLLNEGAGNIANDYSGNQNYGTTTNISDPPTSTSGWCPGPNGGAMLFNGSDNDIAIPENDNYYLSDGGTDTDFAIKFIFQTTTVAIRSLGSTYTSNAGWIVGLRNTNTSIRMYYGGTFYELTVPVWSDGNTHTLIWSRLAGTDYFYFDGKSVTYTGSVDNTISDGNLYIGSIGGSAQFFNGLIDSLFIWKHRGLTAEEAAFITAFPYCMFDHFPLDYLIESGSLTAYYYKMLLAGSTR